MNWIEKHSERQKCVEQTYKAINDFIAKNHCEPSHRDIADATGFPMYSIYSYIDNLKCAGLISVSKNSFPHKISIAKIDVEASDDADHIAYRIKIGDIIKVKMLNQDDGRRLPMTYEDYKVMKFYPHMVLTENTKTKVKRCFSFGDLIVLGYARQPLQIEAIRKSWQ